MRSYSNRANPTTSFKLIHCDTEYTLNPAAKYKPEVAIVAESTNFRE